MSHYNISYVTIEDRHAADLKALRDIREYVGLETYNTLQKLGDGVAIGVYSVQEARFILDMLGIRGYPVAAYCRWFFLKAYREWMHSNEGDGPVWTDEQGFTI